MHEESVELVLLEKELNEFLAVLLAGERRFDVEHRMFGGVDQQLLAEGVAGHGLEALPIVDEAVLEDAFGITLRTSNAVVKVDLDLFPGRAVQLDVLRGEMGTEGATRSGRSLPANPILVLRDPTSMMRGIPYIWLKPCGMYIDQYKETYYHPQMLIISTPI